jgi:hypothetical protein
MPDLRDRLRALDQLEVPDVHERARDIGPKLPIEPGPPASRRLAAGAVALLVAVTAIAFAIGRIGGSVPERSPTEEPSVPATPTDTDMPSPTGILEPVVIGPVAVELPDDATVMAIAADEEGVWLSYADLEGGHLVRLDPATLEVTLAIDDVPVPSHEAGRGGLAFDRGRVLAAGYGGGSTLGGAAVLDSYDPVTGERLTRISLAGSSAQTDLAVTALGIYVLTPAPDPDDGMLLHPLDPDLRSAAPPISLPDTRFGRVVAVGGYVAVLSWTPEDSTTSVVLVDWEGGGIIEQRETHLSGASVIGGFSGWALDGSGRSAVELSGEDLLRPLREIRLPGRAWGLAEGAGGIWAVGAEQAWRLDPGTGQIDTTVELPEAAGGAVTATKDAVYLLSFDGSVTRIARPI